MTDTAFPVGLTVLPSKIGRPTGNTVAQTPFRDVLGANEPWVRLLKEVLGLHGYVYCIAEMLRGCETILYQGVFLLAGGEVDQSVKLHTHEKLPCGKLGHNWVPVRVFDPRAHTYGQLQSASGCKLRTYATS